jgi:hypothetical protein
MQDEVDEIQHLFKQRHHMRLLKNQIVVAALVAAFEDFLANDKESTLYELLKQSAVVE